ncbi:hypothetical protein L210DRAFT_3758111 [Boletus edulis BED1]|uniref:Co-chaperone HscB C-terminal oligomerisation domain-containing protein n=1 Tax=Boletus edulis BED1 TaxID=1328754 RepID=A0AAD4C299_BOLED|nr:hypothetical protein L210DRAFT_3758111 [Boletus edulis BED1]
MNMFHQVGKVWARRQVAGLAQRRGYGVGSRRCPSCGSRLPTALPVCPGCRYVWGLEESVTHHELLGLPYGPNPFVVDRGELKRRFLEAQRLCHPDGWATRSGRDKDAAAAVSNAVNRAYQTLLSPMERIGYVLGRNGKEVGEGEQVEDMGLIMEVMEAREAIEQSEGEVLVKLRETNDGEYYDLSKIKGALGEIEAAVGVEDWTGAKRWAVRLKYLLAIGDALEQRAGNAE